MGKINHKNYILGAIIGDVIGSVYEWNNVKTIEFPLLKENTNFTDDSVLTIASMKAIVDKVHYQKAYQEYGRSYTNK